MRLFLPPSIALTRRNCKAPASDPPFSIVNCQLSIVHFQFHNENAAAKHPFTAAFLFTFSGGPGGRPCCGSGPPSFPPRRS